MATKTSSLFCGTRKNSINDQYAMDCQPCIKSIAWFSQVSSDENVSVDAVNDALNKMEDFLDQKEYEKAEIAAELQLAHAFQDVLEEKRDELLGLMTLEK